MSVKVSIDGLRELDAILGELPKSTAKGVLRRVGKKALQPVADRARSLAPVESGNLRDSIAVSTKLTTRQKRVQKRSGKDFAEVYVGANSSGDVEQEFGTVSHAAQPYMRPAWEAEKKNVLDSIGDDLGKEITKAVKRRAARAAKLAAK